ncbi:DUF4012 domain-containing protein [Rhodococcus hoagii]|nr:DUF4012 domain-containing protein [Prescottella equi]
MEQTKSEESSVETATEAPSRRRTNRRRTVQPAATQRKRRRRIVIGTASAAAVAVAWGGYVAYEATQIKLNLEEAAEFATQTKDALLAGNSEEAVRSADDAARYAGRAKDATDSVSWRIAAAIPGIGIAVRSTPPDRFPTSSRASRRTAQAAVEAGSALSPDQLLLDGARIDLTGLRDAAPVLAETAAAADELAVRASEIDSTFVSQIDGPRQELVGQTTDLSSLLGNVSTAAEIAPAMLGADGPRSYFIGFQTNAEARGNRRTPRRVRRTARGRRRCPRRRTREQPRTVARRAAGHRPRSDFERQYGQSRPTTDFRNSNASSHFPYAAQIWRSLWAQESGTQVDGVIATDPVALSYY